MNQSIKKAMMEADLKATYNLLKNAFPDLQKVPLRESITSSPHLAPLAKRLQLNIPIDAYPSQCIKLYQQINDDYLRHALNLNQMNTSPPIQTNVSFGQRVENEGNQQSQESRARQANSRLRKRKINYLQLSTFIAEFSQEEEKKVTSELIEMGRNFKNWQVSQTSSILGTLPTFNRKDPKPQSADIKFARSKPQKTQELKIVFGKNISLQCKAMRHQIINRAQNNKLLESSNHLSEVQKKQIQMKYILNRITEEYFEDFKQELKSFANNQLYSFALSQKIIEKAMEEHNYIRIYSKLVKSLKNERVLFEGERIVLFRHIFVEKLQSMFYNMIRKGRWQENQELNKKQLLGLSLFLGELFRNRLISKNIFPDIFYELIHKYVIEYRSNTSGKNYYFETYIECIVKLIEKMENYYDQLIKKRNTTDLQKVISEILEINNPLDFEFSHICDYIEVLKQINAKLPSQRFKITFLLEDFRCSKAITKELNNTQAQIVKSILAIDIAQSHLLQRIPSMIQKVNLQMLMKDFFFQFSEGNIKQVNKHIEIYKTMAKNPSIWQATIKSFKVNVEGLYLIQSDFPFLSQGIAKIMRIVCDLKKVDYYQLSLGQDNHPDEDIREFLQKIEEKYFKMLMED